MVGRHVTSFVLALPLVLGQVASVSAQNALESRKPVTSASAGLVFGRICRSIFPDVPAAQIKAQRDGFVYVKSSGLFEHTSKAMEMRINSKRCAIRFLSTTARADNLIAFSNAATKAKAKAQGNIEVKIGVEDAGSGLIRVSAIRDLAK